MRELVILAAVPLLAAVAAWIRLRAERSARATAESRATQLERTLAGHEQRLRDLYPVLAHELRSPLAAILGYEELLEDGTFGQLDERGRDALRRIRVAAIQLTGLVEGLDHFGVGAATGEPVAAVAAADLVAQAIADLQFDADARGTDVRSAVDDTVLRTGPGAARRAVNLALGAAIKATPRGIITVSAAPDAIRIDGTRLSPATDDPAGPDDGAISGAGLRLAFALASARQAGGSVRLEDRGSATRVVIELPASA